jgi:hypothetical protein
MTTTRTVWAPVAVASAIVCLLLGAGLWWVVTRVDGPARHPAPRPAGAIPVLPASAIPTVAEAVRQATGRDDPKLRSFTVVLRGDEDLPTRSAAGAHVLSGPDDTDQQYDFADGRARRVRSGLDSLKPETRRLLAEQFTPFSYSEVPWAALPAAVASAHRACRARATGAVVAELSVSRPSGQREPEIRTTVLDPATGRRADVSLFPSRLSATPADCSFFDLPAGTTPGPSTP